MVRWTIAVAVALSGALSLGAQDPAGAGGAKGESPREQLILFLTPADSELDDVSQQLARAIDAIRKAGRAVDLRFVLLVSDFTKLAKDTTKPEFIALVKELAEIAGEGSGGSPFEMRLVDEEGLALAQKLGIARTPAWALVRYSGKGASAAAHVAYGAKPQFAEVLKCRSR